MKKYNEGYALPFVLVVLVVMCIIAVGIMDFSLRNLESQQKTIQRIEAKYEAAGKIEEIVAAIQAAEANYSYGLSEQLRIKTVDLTPTEKGLRIAASHESSGEEQLWVIVELKKLEGAWPPAVTDTHLTINGNATVVYSWYEIVEGDTAAAFLNGDYPGNGGNG